jgi:hypothetical protein
MLLSSLFEIATSYPELRDISLTSLSSFLHMSRKVYLDTRHSTGTTLEGRKYALSFEGSKALVSATKLSSTIVETLWDVLVPDQVLNHASGPHTWHVNEASLMNNNICM